MRLPWTVKCVLCTTIFVAALISGQGVSAQANSANASQLVDENDYFRVSRIQAPPSSSIALPTRKRDIVLVSLKGDVAIDGQGAGLDHPTVTFIKSGSDPQVQSSEVPGELLVVELKQHWDAEVRSCSEPLKCKRPIRMGDAEIGYTASLFSNGFVTAYRHHLVSRGTLSSSYFSSRGKDHLLFVALTDLQANFDGIEENLKGGTCYPSEAAQIDVNSGSASADWVVIRVQTPK